MVFTDERLGTTIRARYVSYSTPRFTHGITETFRKEKAGPFVHFIPLHYTRYSTIRLKRALQ